MLNAYILGTWTCFVSDSSAHLYRYSVEVNDCAVKCVCVCLGVSVDEKWKRRKKLCVNIYIFYCLYLCGVPSSLHSCANVKWHNLKCVDFRSIFRRRRQNVVHATNLNAIVCTTKLYFASFSAPAWPQAKRTIEPIFSRLVCTRKRVRRKYRTFCNWITITLRHVDSINQVSPLRMNEKHKKK